MRIHLDTDFAGDPDDACALAMVLGWPGAQLVGVTTTADPDGRRAGYVDLVLRLLGASGVPVAVGSGRSLSGRPMGRLPAHARFWGDADEPPPMRGSADTGAALDLLADSVQAGATIVAIGPYTNLGRLHRARPDVLSEARVVTMGGWALPFPAGYPRWGPERDWNVRCDVDAALAVFGSQADLTFVPCAAAAAAWLRTSDLPRLRASGPVGRLLGEQALARSERADHARLGREHSALPDDLANFHWDPVACAVALGWTGAQQEVMELRSSAVNGSLRFDRHPGGRRTSVVTAVDGTAFAETWLACVERAQLA